MDMSMDNSSSTSMTITPLNDSGVDFSNFTQAYNFQQEILNDSILQIIANQYATDFWYGIVVVIGIATIFNVTRKILLRMRIRAAAANKTRPASARNTFTKILGGVTAICREATYPQFSPARTYWWFKVPPFGIILLLLSYLGFILALEFTNNNIEGAQHYQALAVRASWLAVSQIPLLLLLAGKANLISALVGVSYERLNVLHRWVARSILLCVTLHFGYESYGWNLYGLMQLEWETDTCPPTGIAAYSLLLWLNLTTLAPIRNRFYEIFVVQHILSFIAFIYLVMAHLPSTALYSRTYVYIGVGIYFLDRLIRTIRYAYHNIRPGRASLTALEGGVTKIRVQTKQVKSWTPGAHVFLSIPRLGFGQSHPATIASIPSSHNGDLVFILKCHKGFTSRILKAASIFQASQPRDSKQELETSSSATPGKTYITLIGGPYGASHSDPAAFDTVLLISASTGVTFMISTLLSLAHRAQTTPSRLPLRRVDFIWVVKQACWTAWIANELTTVVRDLQDKGIEVKVAIYATCDDNFTYLPPAGKSNAAGAACMCEGSCTCCDATAPADKELAGGDNVIMFSPSVSASASGDENGKKGAVMVTATEIAECQHLPFATFACGRPDMEGLVWELAEQAEGEMGIFACGPLGMGMELRRTVARVSDERAVCMGTGAEGIYLHVESFSW